MKTRHVILLLLLGAVALQCLYYFPLLPAKVSSHFDGAGRPNGWSSKQAFYTLYLFIVGLMTFCFFILPRLLRRVPPSLINLPNREYWLVAERKDQALCMLEDEMGWFGFAILLLMIVTIQLAINANLSANRSGANQSGAGELRSDVMLMLLGSFFIFTIIWVVRLYRRFAVPG